MLRQAGLVLREEVGSELAEGVARLAHSYVVQNCHKVPDIQGRVPQASQVEVDHSHLTLIHQQLVWGKVRMDKGMGNCGAARP